MGSDGYLSADEPNPWVLVKAIQQLQEENKQLSAQIVALGGKPVVIEDDSWKHRILHWMEAP
jgi:hypothetical protein